MGGGIAAFLGQSPQFYPASQWAMRVAVIAAAFAVIALIRINGPWFLEVRGLGGQALAAYRVPRDEEAKSSSWPGKRRMLLYDGYPTQSASPPYSPLNPHKLTHMGRPKEKDVAQADIPLL